MTFLAHSRKLIAGMGLWTCFCAIAFLAAPALSAPPKPPARPADFGKKPSEKNPSEKAPADKTPTGKTPPSTGGVAPAQGAGAAPNGGRQPVDVDVHTLQPYNLPSASRAKMRACGEEWRALKLAGQASGLTWRTFAEKCLVK